MKYKYKINFRLEQRKDSETGQPITKNVPIRLDLTYRGKRLIFYTGYRIDTNKWVDSTSEYDSGETVKVQKVKKNAINKDGIQYNIINNRLDEIKTYISQIFSKAEVEGVNINRLKIECI